MCAHEVCVSILAFFPSISITFQLYFSMFSCVACFSFSLNFCPTASYIYSAKTALPRLHHIFFMFSSKSPCFIKFLSVFSLNALSHLDWVSSAMCLSRFIFVLCTELRPEQLAWLAPRVFVLHLNLCEQKLNSPDRGLKLLINHHQKLNSPDRGLKLNQSSS